MCPFVYCATTTKRSQRGIACCSASTQGGSSVRLTAGPRGSPHGGPVVSGGCSGRGVSPRDGGHCGPGARGGRARPRRRGRLQRRPESDPPPPDGPSGAAVEQRPAGSVSLTETVAGVREVIDPYRGLIPGGVVLVRQGSDNRCSPGDSPTPPADPAHRRLTVPGPQHHQDTCDGASPAAGRGRPPPARRHRGEVATRHAPYRRPGHRRTPAQPPSRTQRRGRQGRRLAHRRGLDDIRPEASAGERRTARPQKPLLQRRVHHCRTDCRGGRRRAPRAAVRPSTCSLPPA